MLSGIPNERQQLPSPPSPAHQPQAPVHSSQLSTSVQVSGAFGSSAMHAPGCVSQTDEQKPPECAHQPHSKPKPRPVPLCPSLHSPHGMP
jgi:hypothetical protein